MNYFQGYAMGFMNSLFASSLDWFHNFNCSLLFGVLVFVSLMFVYLFTNSYIYKSYKVEYQFSELLCSLIPTVLLVLQLIPSLTILYNYGLLHNDSALSIKVVGHQWYWSYDYCDIDGLEFDSYMKPIEDLKLGEPRLLEVDNRCIVPLGVDVRFCITSADVIHSWALPSFAIKADAMSGILSVVNYNFPMPGVFYGQCSEICGVGHSFMPICIEVTTLNNFMNWCIANVY